MGIEGIENLTNGDAVEIETPDTNIEVEHAQDEHGLPDEAVTQGETAEENAAEEQQGTEVTEDPGNAPEDVEQKDDGNTFEEPQPANPNVSEETPNA